MIFMVIVGFLVCLILYFIILFLWIYSDYKLKFNDVLFVLEIIFMVYSVLNFVLYGIFVLWWEYVKWFCFRIKYCKLIWNEIVR